MIRFILASIFPCFKKIKVGSKYVFCDDKSAFCPETIIPKKVSKTHVLYDIYSSKYPNQHPIENEMTVSSFKSFYVLYKQP